VIARHSRKANGIPSFILTSGDRPAGWQGGEETCLTAEDVRKYAAEEAPSEQEAVQKGMEGKSREFVEQCGELYAKD